MKVRKIVTGNIQRAALAVLFFLTRYVYIASLTLNRKIFNVQANLGFRDRGERKYSKESLIIMAIMIPEYTKLVLSEVSSIKGYENLSKEHIYKIISMRKKIDENFEKNSKLFRMEIFKKFSPEEYA